MVSFFGDYNKTETVYIPFNTFSSDDPSASVTITNLANTDVYIHKDGSTTQRSSSSGVTVSIDFDSITGNHLVAIDLSDDTDTGYYADGSRYQVRMEGTTVDGATINAWIGAFSIGCTLRPTTLGRTVDVTSTGAVGIDWGNVENQGTSVDLSATAIDLCDEVTDNTDMRGTDNALLAASAPTNFGDLAIAATTGRVDIGSIEGSDATDQIRDSVVDDSTRIDASALNTLSGHDPGSQIASQTDISGLPSSANIADAVWDEVLTAATHNISTSAGRRLRELAGNIIRAETAQGAGTGNNQIQLDASASATDGAYDPAMVCIINGTGVGQSRLILQYNGSTKIATVDRDWKVNPDATSEFVIYGHPGREHVNEGLAQGGTASTITLNALASSDNNCYIGQTVFVRSGTGEDQSRIVTAYNGSTKVATVDRDWDVTPDTTSGYVMLGQSNYTLTELAVANLDVAVSSRSDFDNTSDQVIVSTNNDKTGYALSAAGIDSIIDEVLTDLTDSDIDSGASITLRKAVRAIFNRFFRKVTQTATVQTVYNDSDSAIADMNVSDDTITQTKGTT